MEQTAVRAHSGWREDEIDQLWDGIRQANASGEPLRTVFEEMGKSLGRKPNSVRNFYYMQLRRREGAGVRRAAPFETFTEDEVRALVRDVLIARSRGQSVRSAVMALSQGDRARMLRYQNKYRSVLKKRPDLVNGVLEELRQEGISCPAPLTGSRPEELLEEVREKANALADPAVRQMLSGMNTLLDRALNADPQVGQDRLRVRLDMATLRYDALCRETGDMLLLCKEYLGQEEDVRTAAMPAFLSELSQRVTRVENAMQ